MTVGASVTVEHRLDEARQHRVALAQPVEGGGGIAVAVELEGRQELPRRVGDVEAGAALGHRLQERRHLQQRVVADSGHRRVAGGAARRDREAEDALLGDADAVDRSAVERDDGPRALVET